MKAAFCILFLAALSLNAQVTKDVRYYNTSGLIQEPIMFFRTNIYAGANISITHSANGTIIISGGAGGGTNAIVLTNGVLVGSIGTLNFIGATGAVKGGTIEIGGFSGIGGGSSVTVASNYVITTPVITNLNFVMGTNIFMVVTNTSGNASVWINVDKFGITNGLATVSYVNQSTQFVTTAHGSLTASNTIWFPAPVNGFSFYFTEVDIGYAFTNSAGRLLTLNGEEQLVAIGNSLSDGKLRFGDATAGVERDLLVMSSSDLNIGATAISTILKGDTNSIIGSSSIPYGPSWWGPYGIFSGRLSLTNKPGEGLPYLEIRSTNTTAYTKFSRLDDNWKPTNYFKFSVTNPVAGQILKFNSVTYSGGEATIILTNDVDTGGSGTPGGGSGNVQFNEGGVFAGTNRLMYDRVNNRLISSNNNFDASIAVTSPNLGYSNYMYADGMSTPIGTYNIHLLDTAGHAISPNYWRFSSTELFYNPGSNTVDLGLITNPWKTNYTKWLRAYDGIQITSESSTTNSITFIVTNAVRMTNIFVFSITNPVAGQIFKFNNVQSLANGQTLITITNDTDNSGGGGGGAFNVNQFSASTLTNLKQYLLITNPIVYSTNVQSTNLVIQLLSGASGAALSILNSAGAMITEVNSNGFFMQTNVLTNYTRGNTLPTPTNIIARGVENYAGRIMPTWFDDKALQFSVQPFLGNNRVFMVLTSAGTAAGTFGVTTAVPAGGTTISHPAPTFTQPYMVSIATGAVSNNSAAIMSSVDLASAGNHNGSGDSRGLGINAGYFFAIEWSDTNNISGIVGGGATRTFTGLTALANTTATNLVVTTNATGQYIGLYSDPKQSLNMYISARDSVAEFRTNTGINFVATNIYQFYLMNTHTSRFAHWKLKDLTARTEAYGWFSNNVPTNFMKMIIATKNGTNRAHSVKFSKMYLETPLTPQ